MIKAAFFDVNETLLDLSALKIIFRKYFDDDYVLKYWFAKLLHSSAVMGVVGEYQHFGELAEEALNNVFFEHQQVLSRKIASEILGNFKDLPVHKDVPHALRLAREHQIKVIAVSNSSKTMMQEQLSNAGIIDFFDAYYSVEEVRSYKPSKQVYLYCVQQEQLTVEEVVMIATHDWDLFGAKNAGLATAYIERKKEIFNVHYSKPDFSSNNLHELIEQILEHGGKLNP